MSDRRSSRVQNIRVFLLSGFGAARRKELGKKIQSLGGRYDNVKDFKSTCTHLICDSISRSEKFLGACATGKWVLHPLYIEDSCLAECWLDEEQYEWCDDHIYRQFKGDYDMAVASRRWRFLLGNTSQAFNGWKVAVVAAPQKALVIKRLLLAGGAEIYHLKFPIKNPAHVADSIGYIFVSANMMNQVAHLIDYGALLMKPDYIADFLIKDPPPDPMDYLVHVNDANTLADNSLPLLENDSFLMSSQRSQYVSPSKKSDILDVSQTSTNTATTASENERDEFILPPLDFDNDLPLPRPPIRPHNTTSPTIKATTSTASYTALFDVKPSNTKSSDVKPSNAKPTDDRQSNVRPSTSTVTHTAPTTVIKTEKISPTKSSATATCTISSPQNNGNITGSSTLSLIGLIDLTGSDDEHNVTSDVKTSSHSDSANKSKNNGKTESNYSGKMEFKSSEKHESKNSRISAVSGTLHISSGNCPVSRPKGSAVKAEAQTEIGLRTPSDKALIASTPIKSIEKRHLRQAAVNLKHLQAAVGMSPITKFFKAVDNKVNICTENKKPVNIGTENKIDIDMGKKTTVLHVSGAETIKISVNNGSDNKATPKHTAESLNMETNQETSRNKRKSGDMEPEAVSSEPKEKKRVLRTVTRLDFAELHNSGTQSNKKEEKTFVQVDEEVAFNIENEMLVESTKKENLEIGAKLGSKSEIETESEMESNVDDKVESKRVLRQRNKSETVIQPENSVKSETLSENDMKSNIDNEEENKSKHVIRKASSCVGFAKGGYKRRSKSGKGVVKRANGLHSNIVEEVESISEKESQIKKRDSLQSDDDIADYTGEVKVSEEMQTENSDLMLTTDVCLEGHPDRLLDSDVDSKSKRKHDVELYEVLLNVKRRKLNQCEWYLSDIVNLRQKQDKTDTSYISSTSTDLIHIGLQDDDIGTSLWYLGNHVSLKSYLEPRTVHTLIQDILLKGENEKDAITAYYILTHLLVVHPPVTGTMQNVYLHSFVGTQVWQDRQVGADWDVITNCLSNILLNNETSGRHRYLFKFIIHLLQSNMYHFMSDPKMRADVGSKNLLVRIVWSPSYHVVYNHRCRKLLQFMSETIQLCQQHNEASTNHDMFEVMDGVLWMVAMVTECSRIHDNLDGIAALNNDIISVFVHEIAKVFIDLNIRDVVLLQTVFKSLRLPWLRVGVCQQMLNTLDDYLILVEEHDKHCINLNRIVSHYFFLLPQFDNIPNQLDFNSPARVRTMQSRQQSTEMKENSEDSSMDKENIDKMCNKVNKKNHKGETSLHTACIRNNVTMVRKILKIPGVDVNARDNAGWTPLHEACNHGHLECVRELLKFVPAKTVDTFFNKSEICRKVDLLAANHEGITPLHDAVLNSRLDVCELLLKHGGQSLLTPKTILNYTPLDLCDSDVMYNLLSSFNTTKRRTSDSQGLLSSSQESSSSCEDNFPVIPSESTYHEVLYMDGKKVFANTAKLVHYVSLVTLLIRNYIHAKHLVQISDVLKLRGQSSSRDHVTLDKTEKVSNCRRKGSYCDKITHLGKKSRRSETSNTDCSVNATVCNKLGQKGGFLSPTFESQGDHIVRSASCDIDFNMKETRSLRFPDTLSNLDHTDCDQNLNTSDAQNVECLRGASQNSFVACNLNGAGFSGSTSQIKFKSFNANSDCLLGSTSGHSVVVSDEEIKYIKGELNMLRRFHLYLDVFRTHLKKISKPEDHGVIDNKLFELECLLEVFK